MNKKLLIFAALIGGLISNYIAAKVTVTNHLPYTIKIWIKYDFGSRTIYVDPKIPGVKDSGKGRIYADAANIKRQYKVWVQEPEAGTLWDEGEPTLHIKHGRGGGFMHIDVVSTLNEAGNFDYDLVFGGN